MAFPGETAQGIGRHEEQNLGYSIGKIFPREEREKLWQEPTPPLPEGLTEPKLTPNAVHVLERRYLRRENGEVVEAPQEMFWRVAHNIAQIEKLYADSKEEREKLAEERRLAFYEMMARLDFLPNSPTLFNAGRELQQLSACFVLPVGDSMPEIFETLRYMALVHQSGGGTGFSFSRLRPKGDIVKSTGGEASGPLSFMEVYDAATNAIKQGGTRRGANMGILHVTHPDILEFIDAKNEPGEERFENFNLSVAVTEDFLDAVRNEEEYDLISPRTGKAVGRLSAKKVFDRIVENVWHRGDPGVVFIDRINKKNPTPHLGKIESTNPCGEQPLLPFESCNLGSINLSKFVKDGEVDWERLRETVHLAVNLLDNVVDANKYIIPQIEEMTMGNRKIGLGIMGLADMLVMLRLPYESDEGRAKSRDMMKFIRDEGYKASMELAEKRGVFPNFKGSIFDKEEEVVPMRNATVTTIAPTGSISIIAGCNGGCEPFPYLAYESMRRLGETDEDNILKEVNLYFIEAVQKESWGSQVIELIKEEGRGMLSKIDEFEIPEWMRRVFVTAHEVPAWGHVKMQAALQEYVDNAVSKTVNFPNSATKEEIAEAYRLADELNCKGITVYRDGSRKEQVFYLREKEAGEVIKRPKVYEGRTYKVPSPVGTVYTAINRDPEDGYQVREFFVEIGKAGSDVKADAEALGRVLSLLAKLTPHIPSEVLLTFLVDQLRGIAGSESIGFGPDKILSMPDAVGAAIEEEYGQKEKPFNKKLGEYCPDCQRILVRGEGCLTCRFCGYERCI